LLSIMATGSCLILLFLLFPSLLRKNVLCYQMGGWGEPAGINFYLDGLSWLTITLTMIIVLFVLIYAWGEASYDSLFYFLVLILVTGMQGAVLTGDIFNMFVFFEIFSIATYILIAYKGEGRSLLAGFNYLLISSLGMGFFLFGISILYQYTGSLSLKEISFFLTRQGENSPSVTIAILCVITGIGIKAAFVPLHTWLPDAHAFSPHPVSAILSGIAIKVSFISIWRFLSFFNTPYIQQTFLVIGAGTAFLGALLAVAQIDIKKILAYHSISQMGFITTSFGARTPFSLEASYYHILNHAFFKSLLFLCMGAIISLTGKREIQKLTGLARKSPFLFFSFLTGAFAICGIPPFNGYASKTLISFSLKNYPLAYFFIFASSILTVTSFTKLGKIFKKGEDEKINSPLPFSKFKLSLKMKLSLSALCLACILTGLFPDLWIKFFGELALGEKTFSTPVIYSSSQAILTSITIIGGLCFYLFIRTPPGEKTLSYVRKTKPRINSSLLLVVAGFLIFVFLSLVMEK
ncbi:hypothetical protein H5U35_09345, partial [Candidatus Aerophobetes bacterium]|nr:hypothetical protein [Candidatus Aerophobetes bacterium]